MQHARALRALETLGRAVRDTVRRSLASQSQEQRSGLYREGADDTIFQIDRDVEAVLVPLVEERAASLGGVRLIAEGVGDDEELVLPHGTAAADAAVVMLLDPIDGTRGIMYDKRSAFFLGGVAPNTPGASLRSIEVAVMTELPTSRAYLGDELWAVRGHGAGRRTRNLLDDSAVDAPLAPSRATTIYQGFGQVARFFPPGRDVLAAIDDEVVADVLPDAPAGKAMVFEDQYISSGGQQYELLVGHDRYTADVRTALYDSAHFANRTRGHACHPYDLAASLIAEEAGVLLTDAFGGVLDCPLDTTTDVDWIGYANADLRAAVEPALQRALKRHGLWVA